MPSHNSDDRLLDAIRGQHVEPVDPVDAEELAALAALGATARSLDSADVDDIDVPDDLWDDVASALDLPAASSTLEPTTEIRPVRRSAKVAPWLAAAAVVVAIAAVSGWWLGRSDTGAGTSVASAELDALQNVGSARAELIDNDGELVLDVTLDGASPGDGYLEVWLIDTGVTKLVSLGPVRSDGRYVIPDGLDPADLPVVDISVEPFDGQPAHSGNSLFRGSLDL